jgi:hypothetical protein
VGQLFSAAIKSGKITREALFDRRYVPIPHTDPPKHKHQLRPLSPTGAAGFAGRLAVAPAATGVCRRGG